MCNSERKLSFVGIGAPRCGTTWISSMLREHPEISFPDVKETYYYSRFPHKSLEWFWSHFKEITKNSVVGEYTTDYYLFPGIAKRLVAENPDIKFIITLRNPADRLFSHYLYRKRNGLYKKSFSECIHGDSFILDMSFYGKHLKNFLRYCDIKNVHLIIYEDFVKNPNKSLADLYKFLGVDTSFIPQSLCKRINSSDALSFHSVFLQSIFIRSIKWRGCNLFSALKKCSIYFGFLPILLKLRRLNTKKNFVGGDVLLPEDREYLRSLFKDDILILEQIFDIQIDVWRNSL